MSTRIVPRTRMDGDLRKCPTADFVELRSVAVGWSGPQRATEAAQLWQALGVRLLDEIIRLRRECVTVSRQVGPPGARGDRIKRNERYEYQQRIDAAWARWCAHAAALGYHVKAMP